MCYPGGTRSRPWLTRCGAGGALGRNRRDKLVVRGLFMRRTLADFFQPRVFSNTVRFSNASLGRCTLEGLHGATALETARNCSLIC